MGPHISLPYPPTMAEQKLLENKSIFLPTDIFPACLLMGNQLSICWEGGRERNKGGRWVARGRHLASQSEGSIITYSQQPSSVDTKRQRQQDLHWLWGLWSSERLRSDTVQSWPPDFLSLPGGPVGERFGRACSAEAQHRDHVPRKTLNYPPGVLPLPAHLKWRCFFQVVNESCQTKSHFKSTLCKNPVLQHISFINYAMD